MTPTCPICDASGDRLERLRDGWRFCNRCGYAHVREPETGQLIGLARTNHEVGRERPQRLATC